MAPGFGRAAGACWFQLGIYQGEFAAVAPFPCLSGAFHDGRGHAGNRVCLLRPVGRLRLRLRSAVRDRHDLRLLARRDRDRSAARLPDLRAAQA